MQAAQDFGGYGGWNGILMYINDENSFASGPLFFALVARTGWEFNAASFLGLGGTPLVSKYLWTLIVRRTTTLARSRLMQ